MNTSKTNPINYGFAAIAALFVFGVFTGSVHAQWQNLGNGIWRDNNNLEWKNFNTVTGSLQGAEQTVAKQGFRLPTHSEYRSLEGNGGINRLGIPTSTYNTGACWEATGGIVHGYGGNLKSLFPSNHFLLESRHRVIGVRNNPGGEVPVNPPQGVEPQPSSQPTNNGKPKVHLIFVWGTKDKDVYWATMISREKVLDAFKNKFQLPYERYVRRNGQTIQKSPDVGVFVELLGDNAHPQKIIEACRQVSKLAGQNDAVLVYMLCHGAKVPGENNIHALSPVATSATAMNLKTIGIRRSTIMRELKANPHRLNALITDSCSVKSSEGQPVECSPNFPPREMKIPAIKKILLYEHGTININSSNPSGGYSGEGELARAWIPGPNKEYSDYLKYAVQGFPYSGTVFTGAFIEESQTPVAPNASYSIADYIRDLRGDEANGSGLHGRYEQVRDYLDREGDPALSGFMTNQDTQTLTQFDDSGRAISE